MTGINLIKVENRYCVNPLLSNVCERFTLFMKYSFRYICNQLPANKTRPDEWILLVLIIFAAWGKKSENG